MTSIEYYATGRRKTSTARVFLRPGKGAITVNHREFDRYFPTDALRTQVRRPLLLIHLFDLRRVARERGWTVFREDLGGFAAGWVLVLLLVGATAALLAM